MIIISTHTFKPNISIKFHRSQNPGKQVLSTYCNSQSQLLKFSKKDNKQRLQIKFRDMHWLIISDCPLLLLIAAGVLIPAALLGMLIVWAVCWAVGMETTPHITAQLTLAHLPRACRVEEMLCCNGKAGVPYIPFSMWKMGYWWGKSL